MSGATLNEMEGRLQTTFLVTFLVCTGVFAANVSNAQMNMERLSFCKMFNSPEILRDNSETTSLPTARHRTSEQFLLHLFACQPNDNATWFRTHISTWSGTHELSRMCCINGRDSLKLLKKVFFCFQLNIRLMRKVGSDYRSFLFNIDQDLCAFLVGTSSKYSSMISKVLNANSRRHFGNFFDPCPFSVLHRSSETSIF